MSKIHIEDIKEELSKKNWKVISEEYINLDTEMIFECDEGHKVYTTWGKLRNKLKCPFCESNKFKKIDSKKPAIKNTDTVILALDQATYITGWSVYINKQLIQYGIFTTNSDNEIERDYNLKIWLINMIDKWKPDCIALEGIQYQENKGITTYAVLARLQGILMETIYEIKIPYLICPTPTWRNYCGVKGKTKADMKRSMQNLVKKWYDISITNDEADAIGIGKYVSEQFVKNKIVVDFGE